MFIDKQSPIPMYHQIMENLKKQIEDGTLAPDTLIPSEREYAERFDISRMTVRQALSNLVNEGYLYRQKGKGTFVSRKKFEQPLQGLTSFTEDMRQRGLKASSQLVDFKKTVCPEHLLPVLQLSNSDAVYELKRIRLANDEPMAIETSYIPETFAGELTKKHLTGSLYEYIENHTGLAIAHAKQELEANVASEQEAHVLSISTGSPVLSIARTTYFQNDLPFEYVLSVYRGDRYKLIHTMER
ncbi:MULTISPECIES: GntR family transcriptional regulator [Bacillus]|uniref:Phosphonate metabolism transcriptional regulator PhnF n=1 Tax=Bacillus pumilus TaxID=1408 RepID=A0A2G8IWN6_BACPU|nr:MULTISPECIES: GntR family transcriptional regulator [Bacillus]MCC9088429.1 GntR family transcriptional regulator [Bacillus pumilus]MED1747464.1 GntR family transcriptional regulator [Bacillus zhangzhouensis]PIK27918.1 phosphonate metabolism transcriptional regulator PhnF [Bacillus pumilus]UUD42223.1 GntR family transcriptional regulator [Bacillus pumilus]